MNVFKQRKVIHAKSWNRWSLCKRISMAGAKETDEFVNCPRCLILMVSHGLPNDGKSELYTGRRCRICGCTNLDACEDPDSIEGVCTWVEHDLCNVCAPEGREGKE